jgi:hypothetical protein
MLGSILDAPSPASFFFFSPGKLVQNYTQFFFKKKIVCKFLKISPNLIKHQKNWKNSIDFYFVHALGQSNGPLAFGLRQPLFWEHPSPWALPYTLNPFWDDLH